ncbi:trypco2 family protein, partial [Streptosporangium pseudovulgare]|uniref:trypco2 family protein n=1 Tax=Streptosporangium pseudovulgare TaxID=35765 RepID=UPI0027E561C8
MVEIELADAVEAVRDELLAAAVRGAGSEIAFTVGPIELEFAVELKVDAKAKGGFKAWVVT